MIDLFIDGVALRQSMEDAIRAARRRVWIETFILGHDPIGDHFVELAADAARRGCEVIVIADYGGSPGFGFRQYRPVIEAGGTVRLYNPPVPWPPIGRPIALPWHRDHRKILIADDVAFTGGHNLADDYLVADPKYYDTSVRLEGDGVEELADIFRMSLCLARGKHHNYRADGGAGLFPLKIQAQDVRRNLRRSEEALRELLSLAKDRCFLTMAYFMPPDWLRNDLARLVRTGVDVRVMVAGHSDIKTAQLAVRDIYPHLVSKGVRVFELREQQLHAKNVTIDGQYALVGSFDFNEFSRKHSLEVTVTAQNEKLAVALDEAFESNMKRSVEVGNGIPIEAGPIRRLVQKGARLLHKI